MLLKAYSGGRRYGVNCFNVRVHTEALVLASSLSVLLIESDLIYEVASNIEQTVEPPSSTKTGIADHAVYGTKLVRMCYHRKLSAVAFMWRLSR